MLCYVMLSVGFATEIHLVATGHAIDMLADKRLLINIC